jgi:hypothetical protein
MLIKKITEAIKAIYLKAPYAITAILGIETILFWVNGNRANGPESYAWWMLAIINAIAFVCLLVMCIREITHRSWW